MGSLNKNIREFSKRRKKLIYIGSYVNIFSAIAFAVVFYLINFKTLAYMVAVSAFLFFIAAVLAKKGYLKLARSIFLLTFNISVAIIASFVGKNASIEFFLLYAIGVPFTVFSIRRERFWLVFYAFLPIVLLTLLYVFQFNFFGVQQLDPETAKNYVYPFSMTLALLLIVFQLIYFSYVNAGYNSSLHSKKQRALDASNAKSDFLSTMSHEIRTPLNAVIGLSYILGDNNPRKDQIENIEALNYSGQILLNLLNDVLDYNKMQTGEIHFDRLPVNLYDATKQIKKVHEASCIKKAIDFNLEIEKDIPVVWLDITRFNQVINNLVSNAIKFTETGSVTLKINCIKQTNTHITILTEVIDTGIGIPKEKQDSIWKAFSQASTSTNRLYGGTGLGLPIVKSIVKQVDSDIFIDSEVGKGSRFYFEVALKIASEEDLEKNTEKKEYNFEGKNVLLVEDNDINIMVGQQILEKAKLTVDVAKDGVQAVKMAKQNNYNIILMDIQMPIMDGYEATKQIRKFDTTTPIYALSASVFMEAKETMKENGIDGFIFKPFNPDDLLNRLDLAIQENK